MPRLFVMGRVTVRLTLAERAQLARAAEAAGVSYAEECEAMLQTAERAANEAARRVLAPATPPEPAAAVAQAARRPAPAIPPDPNTMIDVKRRLKR